MRNICKYIFALTLGIILSCSKEDYNLINFNDTIEFIALPANFNDTEVTTKSEPTETFETAIETLYLLIFDSNGNRVFFTGNEEGTLNQKVSKKGLTTVKACLIANVTREFAEGIESVEELESAVIENISYATFSQAGHFGVPKLTVGEQTKLCFPMVGCTQDINIKDLARVQIHLKRLFAKVSVSLQLDLDLSDWNNLIQTYTYFELQNYELKNLPTKVRLLESNDESAWIKDGESFVKTELGSGTINSKIYNTNSTTSNNKSYEFYFYVPEYYLDPIELTEEDAGYQNQKYKPKNYPDDKLPVHLILQGNYSQYSLTSMALEYKIFLGGDTHSNYSLGRNIHYNNIIKIIGTDNNKDAEGDNLDWRVSTTLTNNPVAKEGKSANCYVISNTGPYSFPAYKGAYNDLTEAVLCNNQTARKLEEIANDNSDNIVLENLVYDSEKNIVSFNISKIANGNVVIALKNADGSTEWSWHLWCNPGNQFDILGWGALSNDEYPNGSVVNDRNLGSTSSTDEGLYYKYGYKEPLLKSYKNFMGGGTNGNNTWNAANNSNTNNNTKAVNDPCPPGYKIPGKGAWNIGAGASGTSTSWFVYNLSNPNVTLYYNGYWYYDSQSQQYIQTKSKEENKEYTLQNYRIEALDLDIIPSYINQTGGLTSKNKTRTKVEEITEYYDFEYKAITVTNFGKYWYSNGEAFHYEASSVDWTKILEGAFEIVRCKTLKYKKYQDQKSTNYGVSYSNVGNPYYSDYQDGTKTSGFTLYIGTIYNEARKADLNRSTSKHDSNTSYGYPVRCVVDNQ